MLCASRAPRFGPSIHANRLREAHGSSDDGAVIRVATAWLGRAMQWLLVRVRVITLTQTSCAIVRSASEVHNSAESWLRRPAEKACCQGMARAARVF